MTSGPD